MKNIKGFIVGSIMIALATPVVAFQGDTDVEYYNGKWYDSETRGRFTGTIGGQPAELMVQQFPGLIPVITIALEERRDLIKQITEGNCGFDVEDGVPNGLLFCMPRFGDTPLISAHVSNGQLGYEVYASDPDSEMTVAHVVLEPGNHANGVVTRFDKQFGEIEWEIPFANAKKQGLASQYNPDNNVLILNMPYAGGNRTGKLTAYHPKTGKIIRTATLQYGQEYEVVHYDENEQPIKK